MEIHFEECPNCGEMIFDEDLSEGYCPGCGLDLTQVIEDAA